MKKLLSTLGVIAILGSTISNVITNDFYHKTLEQNNRSIKLWVIRRIQETNWFCVPTDIQMIFGYFNIARRQTQIYNDLGGVGENGLLINQNLVNYLNNNIRPVNQNINYGLVQIHTNFGHTRSEQLLFENYVYESLFNNHPLLFGYSIENDGHAILITGININENNPGETQYTYLEPADGAQMTFKRCKL
ncbi:C39 family peptidase [Spiroplasma endosymbiont of Glossina fuscipes fuscipes]|uniref:C39 family peptidase n=1 Tax=Spiroplasma endosymbiont of Glossina fuscipes fuscipes TaxID=2004463 RepID=UPI003C777506